MFTTYRTILGYPGAAAFAFSGLLARLPTSMFNISIILMVQIQYESYEMAGRVAAVGILVWALQTVPTARLVDRIGQRRGMIPLVLLYLTGAGLAIYTSVTEGPEWMLWIAVAVASCSGPLGSLTRARWTHMLKSDREIHSAFSLEGALDEVLFIGGPALATILATTFWPPAGLVVCSIGMIVGLSILLSQSTTEPPLRKDVGGKSLGWRVPLPVLAVTVIAFGLGLMFGGADISAIAFAEEHGFKKVAGALIGAIAAGSLTGGLLYGVPHWRIPLWVRTVACTAIMAIGFTALAASPNVAVFAILGFIAGATIAPTITNVDTVVQRVVDRSQITEGMAWVRIGMGVGVAVGAWVAGIFIDDQGARSGLVITAICAGLTLAFASVMIPLLKRAGGRDEITQAPNADQLPVVDGPVTEAVDR